MVKVTNKRNGHVVHVRINDRGPFKRGRIIDLTPAAAQRLGFDGLALVSLENDVISESTLISAAGPARRRACNPAGRSARSPDPCAYAP